MADIVHAGVRALERAGALMAGGGGNSPRWFRAVTPEVEAAYERLGGSTWVPLELLRLVLDFPGYTKRVVILRTDGVPWALVPLRLVDSYWEPMLFSVLPGVPSFICSRDRGQVFGKVGVALRVWESELRTWECSGVRWSTEIPWREVQLHEDLERYWRSRELWKTIIQAKRRTEGFDVVVDDPESAEWAIKGWRERFARVEGRDITRLWRERVIASNWGLANGTMHCWGLRDQHGWVAAATGMNRDGRLALGTLHRATAYGWYGAGNRILYEMVMWARENGLDSITLGGHFGYKRRWAPVTGARSQLLIAPVPAAALLGAVERSRELWGRMQSRRAYEPIR